MRGWDVLRAAVMSRAAEGKKMGQPIWKFSRPADKKPTNALFIGNCSPALGIDIHIIVQMCRSLAGPEGFSPQEIVVPSPDSSHVFAVFENETQAQRVYEQAQQVQQVPPKPSTLVARTADALGIPGLHLLHEFIDTQEEGTLLAAVQTGQWQSLARRRVQHYGWEFDYATRSFGTRAVKPLPSWALSLASRISALPCVAQPLDQITVNEYAPGVGLAPHVDTHSAFTGAIISLSLGSDCVMELRRGADHRPLLLPRRSLLVLSGESRYAWQHYIPNRKYDDVGQPEVSDGHVGSHSSSDLGQAPAQCQPVARGTRVSLTFRKVRGYACDCPWPDECDSRQGGPLPTRIAALPRSSPPEAPEPACELQPAAPVGPAGATTMEGGGGGGRMNGCREGGPPDSGSSWRPDAEQGGTDAQQDAQEQERSLQVLEDAHVHSVYDAIAPHFSATRFAVWPKVKEFVCGLPAGAILADVGCGNGKYFGIRSDVAVLGSDRSAGLAELAARRVVLPGQSHVLRADVIQADGLSLPYREGCCDGVLCIAVLHHVSSRARRVRLLQALVRLLRPGGSALVTVWALEQEEPDKTLAKWSRIAAPEAEMQQRMQQQHEQQQQEHMGQLQAVTPSDEPETKQKSRPLGADFMVPWHLPFHRANVAAAVAKVPGQEQAQHSGESLPQALPAQPWASVDSQKGSIVFQRYYHLFEAGELEDLVAEVPACTAAQSFYDKSNWCVVILKH